jgi:hypothetical protein
MQNFSLARLYKSCDNCDHVYEKATIVHMYQKAKGERRPIRRKGDKYVARDGLCY